MWEPPNLYMPNHPLSVYPYSVLRDNLRRIQDEPAVLIIEVAWRWLFGAAAIALLVFAFLRLQHAVVINSEEEELLSSMSPTLMMQAMVTILARALPIAARLAAVIIPALLVLWVVAASVGRAAVITRLLGPQQSKLCWSGFIGIHILRALSVLGLFSAYIACSFIAALFAGPDPSMFVVTLIFLLLFGITVVVWMWVHWVLSLAAIFPVRDEATTWSSVRSALLLVRRDGKQLSGIAAANASARTLLALIFTFFGLLPLALYRAAPGLLFFIEAIIILVYCILSDWLLLGRLVAYLEVTNKP